MDKLNSLKIIIIAEGVNGNVYETETEYKLNDIDVSLAQIQSRATASVVGMMDYIDGMRKAMQEESDE